MSAQYVQPVAAPHVYRPKMTPATILGWLELILVSILLYAAFNLFVSHASPRRSFINAVIWAALYWPIMYGISLRGRSLTIYADAFVYQTRGRTIQADWRDVERIERRWWPSPLLTGDRLVLRRDRFPQPRWGWWNGGRTIPLTAFDPHWREGALGYDLRYFASHLFDAEMPQ